MKNKELTSGHPIFRIGGDTSDLIKDKVDTNGVYLQSSFNILQIAARVFLRDQWFDSNEH